MSSSNSNPFIRLLVPRLLIAAASGFLLVLALPKPDFYYLGWVALVPLLVVLSKSESRPTSALIGYAAGLAFFGGSCYWIVATMSIYGGLSVPLSLAVFSLFVVVFAGHTALFALLMRWHAERFGIRGMLLAAPTWVAVELVQSHLIFGGFPWMLAGYALAPFGGLLQIVTWTGVYGLSFVLVGVGSLVAYAVRARDPRALAGAVAVVIMAFVLPTPSDETPADPFQVRMVQTNIAIDQSWGVENRTRLMDELQALTVGDDAAPDLVIWPETPSPFRLEDGAFFAYRARSIARELDSEFLFGYMDSIGEMPSNSVGIMAPSGEQVGRYNKIHLVPFGEYVPIRNILFFAESMVRNIGDFARGTEYTVSPVSGHLVAATICYEDVFPGLIRQFTKRGAEVIVNITNDGWFGETSAPYQHLRMSSVRAAENRRYIVRGANTGVTAIIDPYGNVVAQTEIGERTVLDGVAGYRQELTFYVRFGDVFAYLATISMIGVTVLARRRQPGIE
jgi:apolipoprotein N-acyltransferase